MVHIILTATNGPITGIHMKLYVISKTEDSLDLRMILSEATPTS